MDFACQWRPLLLGRVRQGHSSPRIFLEYLHLQRVRRSVNNAKFQFDNPINGDRVAWGKVRTIIPRNFEIPLP